MCTPSAVTSLDLLAGVDLDTEVAQRALGRLLQALGQRRQHARRRLDQAHLDVAVGIEAAQAVADQLAGGVAQLGGELDPGRARAHDREAQPPPAPSRPALAAQKAAEHLLVDALGLRRAVQKETVLPHARHAEIVEHAADRDHQRVVAEPPAGHQLRAARVGDRTEQDLAPRAIEAAHLGRARRRSDAARACAK